MMKLDANGLPSRAEERGHNSCMHQSEKARGNDPYSNTDRGRERDLWGDDRIFDVLQNWREPMQT